MAWRDAIRAQGDGVVVEIRARPASKREGVEVAGDQIVVKVRAPPVDGKANQRIVEVFAAAIGVKRRQVTLVRGQGARTKQLAVSEIERAAVVAALT